MSELYCDWLLLVCSARGIQVANPLSPVFAWRKDFFVHITASALCPGYNLLTLYKRWLLSEFKGMTGWIVGWQSRTLGVQEVLVNEELNLSASLFFLFFCFILLIAFIFLSHHRQLVLSVVTAQHSLMLYWYFECLSGCIFLCNHRIYLKEPGITIVNCFM